MCVQELERNSISKNLLEYSENEIKNISSNKIIIAKNIDDIKRFVKDELNKKTSNNKIFYGKVGIDIATRIEKNFHINIFNYNISLKGDNVRKIIKDHGNESIELEKGQINVSINDFNYIADIISEPDIIYLSNKKTKQGKPSLIFEKEINNKYTLVEFVSDKNHTLEVQTMYIHKKRTLSTGDDAC